MACSICCETFNKSSRKSVVCGFCHVDVCAFCVQRYLVTVDDPECMACKLPWTHDFVDIALTKTFVYGPLKKHRENVLFNRERSLLPATQLTVQRMMRYKDACAYIKVLERELWNAKRRLRRPYTDDGEEVATERRQFVKPCPAEGCRGFLSTQYKCGMCSVNVCPSCHEIKSSGGEHACNPDIVANVLAIQTDSKPCPKCGCMIFRIYGCNQMYCTAPGCKTVFCWKTLRILDTERIHNPHYYEYMQRHRGIVARELDDIPCGGMPTARALTGAILFPHKLSATSEGMVHREVVLRSNSELFAMHIFAVHVQMVEMQRYPAAPDVVNITSNEDIRIRFLKGVVSETRFKEILQQREKQRMKKNAINQILATVAHVSSDLFRKIVLAKGNSFAVQNTIVNMHALRDYANESLTAVSKRYSCMVPVLYDKWLTPLATAKA